MSENKRVKPSDNYAIYHVMVKSIDEAPLFKEDSDKEEYLAKVRHYQAIYKFKVYGYCLMTNHGHFIIDASGANISDIMHDLNFTYAQKYNQTYKRGGPLFRNRFKSKIVGNARYLITLSAYIHNNPHSISKQYKDHPEQYKYSSLAAYLGIKEDEFGILDKEIIMKLFGRNTKKARRNYYNFIFKCDDEKMEEEVEFQHEEVEFENEEKLIIRDVDPKKILKYVAMITGMDVKNFYIKYSRNTVKARALSVLMMRCLCNLRCSDISKMLTNVTQSTISRLCNVAVELINNDERYKDIIDDFLIEYI